MWPICNHRVLSSTLASDLSSLLQGNRSHPAPGTASEKTSAGGFCSPGIDLDGQIYWPSTGVLGAGALGGGGARGLKPGSP